MPVVGRWMAGAVGHAPRAPDSGEDSTISWFQIGIDALLEALLRFAVRKHAGDRFVTGMLDFDSNGVRYFPGFVQPHAHVRRNGSSRVRPFLCVGAEDLTNLRQAPLAAIFDLILA